MERHAYNGCANCGCGVTWNEHPDKERDTSPSGRMTLAWQRGETDLVVRWADHTGQRSLVIPAKPRDSV